jgi:hypothetical protein
MSFVSTRTVREIGACLDLWDPASLGVHIEVDLTRDGADVPVVVLNTHCELSRSHAARLAGLLGADDRAITAIGLGALGSQAFDILHRMGWGRWTLIDDDLLFPHNLARHQLNSNAIGWPKALALATSTTDTLCDDEVRFVVADVIDPRDKAEAVRDSLHNADIILDMSASISVARFLASDVASTGRRTSVFLNPTGTDSVLLVENETRTAPLDWLEMQYYRTLITQPGLQRHLRDRRGAVPYAHTCRDVSSVIPQELVALHAALTARGLRLALDRAEGTITIWQTEDDDTVVRRHQVDATPAIDHRSQGWLVRTDQEFVNKVNDLRMARLPNETGGVLVGAYDHQRRIIYVVDLLPSPKDSTEWPTAYIRGCDGLADAVEAIGNVTARRLTYVGEWHSHPARHDCGASDEDRHAFAWLSAYMAQDGLPPLMLIVGDDHHAWYVGDIP